MWRLSSSPLFPLLAGLELEGSGRTNSYLISWLISTGQHHPGGLNTQTDLTIVKYSKTQYVFVLCMKTIGSKTTWNIYEIMKIVEASSNIRRQLHDWSVFCTLIAKYHHAMLCWLVRSVTCEYFCKKQRKDNLNCSSAIHTLLDIGYLLIMKTFLTSYQLPCGIWCDIDQKCRNFTYNIEIWSIFYGR